MKNTPRITNKLRPGWESLETYVVEGTEHVALERLRVPGGWLVRSNSLNFAMVNGVFSGVNITAHAAVFIPHGENLPGWER